MVLFRFVLVNFEFWVWKLLLLIDISEFKTLYMPYSFYKTVVKSKS